MLIWILAFLSVTASAAEPSWNAAWHKIDELAAVLESVPEGHAVLAQARKKNPKFLEQLHQGEASYTESTFVRTYSLLDGKERIELRHELTLSRHLTVADAVVDLAHELVHFTDKGMLDPYRPGFEMREFVKNGIEGPGGELAALKKECLVAWELERKYQNYPAHQLCASYHAAKGAFDTGKAKRDYYAVGPWFYRTDSAMRKSLPEMNDAKVQFNSSYASKPYPVALAEEFRETKRAACANNRRKYRLIAAQATAGGGVGVNRAPASNRLEAERSRLKWYDENFCRNETGLDAEVKD